MKKFFYFIFGLFLLPLYPFLKWPRVKNEKIKFGEKVIVVRTRDGVKSTF
jgi:hypothetical protein